MVFVIKRFSIAKNKVTALAQAMRAYKYAAELEGDLADIRAYDSSMARVHKEVASGRFSTLKDYKAGRKFSK
jgi:hypothetical protein